MVRHLLLLCVGAQTGCPEEPPPAPVGVCASLPGKPYSSVEGRKLFAGKRRRRLWEFAPPSRESLILPSRGANLLPGRIAAGGGGLRLTPGKALFLRRGAQTLHRGIRLDPVGVCASHPGKPYFSVERRKPFTRKSRRSQCEFAPHSRERIIFPLRGANPSPGKPPEEPRRLWEFAPPSRESLILPLRGANPSPGKAPSAGESLRLPPGKALFFR